MIDMFISGLHILYLFYILFFFNAVLFIKDPLQLVTFNKILTNTIDGPKLIFEKMQFW